MDQKPQPEHTVENPKGYPFHAVLGQRYTIQKHQPSDDALTIRQLYKLYEWRSHKATRELLMTNVSALIGISRRFPSSPFVVNPLNVEDRLQLALALSEMLAWFSEQATTPLRQEAFRVHTVKSLYEGINCISLVKGTTEGHGGHTGARLYILSARMRLRFKNDKQNRHHAHNLLDEAVRTAGEIPIPQNKMVLYRELGIEYRRARAWQKSFRWGFRALCSDHVPLPERLKCLSALVFGFHP